MKKMFALLTALTMTASLLAGCGSSAAPAVFSAVSASASGATYDTVMPKLDSILNNATVVWPISLPQARSPASPKLHLLRTSS